MTCRRCPQPIAESDLLQRPHYYWRIRTPSFVHIRYRCPGCDQIGERFVEEERWTREVMAMTYTLADLQARRQALVGEEES